MRQVPTPNVSQSDTNSTILTSIMVLGIQAVPNHPGFNAKHNNVV